jgi:proline dehydrogenase
MSTTRYQSRSDIRHPETRWWDTTGDIADVRIVKGAYQEPASIALQRLADIREAFRELLRIAWAPATEAPRAERPTQAYSKTVRRGGRPSATPYLQADALSQ